MILTISNHKAYRSNPIWRDAQILFLGTTIVAVNSNMFLTNEKLETLELEYLNEVYQITVKHLNEILNRFYSRVRLYDFWKKQFAESEEIKRLSDLGVGAERVFHHLFAQATNWLPSSIPVGSNLFYETDKVFINIDIKSVYVENSWDYLGVAEVGERQTSYSMQDTWKAEEKFMPQLPQYYKINDTRKACVTYIMQMLHVDIDQMLDKNYDRNAVALILLAVPNGALYNEYGEDIIEEPKSYHKKKGKRHRPANFRYAYYKYPNFAALKKKSREEYRCRVLFNKGYFGERFITTWKYRKKLAVKMLPEEITQLPENIIKKFTRIFEKGYEKTIVTEY